MNESSRAERHDEIIKEIAKIHQRITDHNIIDAKFRDELRVKLDPMYEVFTNVRGFNGIAIWIMKILAGLGVAIGGLYALIEFFKRVGR